jgi:hypothetical protein
MPGHVKKREVMYYSISSTALVNHNVAYIPVARQQPQNKPLLSSSFTSKHVPTATIDLQQWGAGFFLRFVQQLCDNNIRTEERRLLGWGAMWTNVSEERIAPIFRVEKSGREEPTWAGSCRLRHQSNNTQLYKNREGGRVGYMGNQ